MFSLEIRFKFVLVLFTTLEVFYEEVIVPSQFTKYFFLILNHLLGIFQDNLSLLGNFFGRDFFFLGFDDGLLEFF